MRNWGLLVIAVVAACSGAASPGDVLDQDAEQAGSATQWQCGCFACPIAAGKLSCGNDLSNGGSPPDEITCASGQDAAELRSLGWCRIELAGWFGPTDQASDCYCMCRAVELDGTEIDCRPAPLSDAQRSAAEDPLTYDPDAS